MDWMLAVPAALAGAIAGAWVRHWFSRGQPGAPRAGASSHHEEVAGLARRSLDSLRVGVLVLDAEDRPVLFNSASRALGLLRAGTQLGKPVAHPVVRGLAGQVRRTGVRREVELDLSHEPAGAPAMAVHLRAVGLGGDVVAVEAADVTEAHRVARVRRDFVANVSHELKTPIGALQLLSEALLDATAAGDPAGGADRAPDVQAARRFAERIHRESTRLGGLVTELIELSRLQGADPLPAPEPVSLDTVVAEVVDRARTGAAAKGIEIEVTGAHGLVVYGSEAQLVTAVANLVENAVAYSPKGSRVVVHTSRGEDTVDIRVIDQGMGIAETDLDRIFERFYRADQARSRATGGTGLGLAIVKHIATNHGGRVEVSSTVGVGSTFTLRLPARSPDVVPASPESVGLATSPVAEGSA